MANEAENLDQNTDLLVTIREYLEADDANEKNAYFEMIRQLQLLRLKVQRQINPKPVKSYQQA